MSDLTEAQERFLREQAIRDRDSLETTLRVAATPGAAVLDAGAALRNALVIAPQNAGIRFGNMFRDEPQQGVPYTRYLTEELWGGGSPSPAQPVAVVAKPPVVAAPAASVAADPMDAFKAALAKYYGGASPGGGGPRMVAVPAGPSATDRFTTTQDKILAEFKSQYEADQRAKGEVLDRAKRPGVFDGAAEYERRLAAAPASTKTEQERNYILASFLPRFDRQGRIDTSAGASAGAAVASDIEGRVSARNAQRLAEISKLVGYGRDTQGDQNAANTFDNSMAILKQGTQNQVIPGMREERSGNADKVFQVAAAQDAAAKIAAARKQEFNVTHAAGRNKVDEQMRAISKAVDAKLMSPEEGRRAMLGVFGADQKMKEPTAPDVARVVNAQENFIAQANARGYAQRPDGAKHMAAAAAELGGVLLNPGADPGAAVKALLDALGKKLGDKK